VTVYPMDSDGQVRWTVELHQPNKVTLLASWKADCLMDAKKAAEGWTRASTSYLRYPVEG
jgi:hypothetical protein